MAMHTELSSVAAVMYLRCQERRMTGTTVMNFNYLNFGEFQMKGELKKICLASVQRPLETLGNDCKGGTVLSISGQTNRLGG